MIICICKNVNSSQVQEALGRGVRSLEQLERETGLGSCCGKCRFTANRMINEQANAVQHFEPAQSTA